MRKAYYRGDNITASSQRSTYCNRDKYCCVINTVMVNDYLACIRISEILIFFKYSDLLLKLFF